MRLSPPRHLLLLGLLAVSLGLGCASAPRPRVSVLGVTRARIEASGSGRSMLVEVTNPTSHSLTLAGFAYRFVLRGAEVGRGEVLLDRGIPAGQTAVIELPLPTAVTADDVADVLLEGQLRSSEGYAQGGWNVRARGIR